MFFPMLFLFQLGSKLSISICYDFFLEFFVPIFTFVTSKIRIIAMTKFYVEIKTGLYLVCVHMATESCTTISNTGKLLGQQQFSLSMP